MIATASRIVTTSSEPITLLDRIHRFTVAEYHELDRLGFITTAHRVELLNGLIVQKVRISPPHAYTTGGVFKLLYRPDLVVAAINTGSLPGLPGISSFGGVAGALAGGWAYLWTRGVRGQERLRYLDAVGFAFPISSLAKITILLAINKGSSPPSNILANQ